MTFRIFVGASVVKPFADRMGGIAGTEHVYITAPDADAALAKARGAGVLVLPRSIQAWPRMPVQS